VAATTIQGQMPPPWMAAFTIWMQVSTTWMAATAI
jgi:hypothetical protein